MAHTITKLARAIERLGATDIGGGLYAYWAAEMSCYYVAEVAELESLCDYMDDDDPQISRDAYSHWCAGSDAREMPRGWTPEMGLDEDSGAAS